MYNLNGVPLTEEEIKRLSLGLADKITLAIKENSIYRSFAYKILWENGSTASLEDIKLTKEKINYKNLTCKMIGEDENTSSVEDYEAGTKIIIESETDALSYSLSHFYWNEQCENSSKKFVNQIDEHVLGLLFQSLKKHNHITVPYLNFDNAIQSVFEQFLAEGLVAAKVLMNPITRRNIIKFSNHAKSFTEHESRLEYLVHFFGHIEQADVHCWHSIPENKILVLPPRQYLGTLDTIEDVLSYPNQETSSIQILSKGVLQPTIVHPERIRCVELVPDA